MHARQYRRHTPKLLAYSADPPRGTSDDDRRRRQRRRPGRRLPLPPGARARPAARARSGRAPGAARTARGTRPFATSQTRKALRLREARVLDGVGLGHGQDERERAGRIGDGHARLGERLFNKRMWKLSPSLRDASASRAHSKSEVLVGRPIPASIGSRRCTSGRAVVVRSSTVGMAPGRGAAARVASRWAPGHR